MSSRNEAIETHSLTETLIVAIETKLALSREDLQDLCSIGLAYGGFPSRRSPGRLSVLLTRKGHEAREALQG